jgi:hypothetical protein
MGMPKEPVERSMQVTPPLARPAWDRWLDPRSRSGSSLPALGMALMFFVPGWWRLTGFVLWLVLDARALMLARLQGTARAWTHAVTLTAATVALGLQLFWSPRPLTVTVVLWGVLLCCFAVWFFSWRKR